VSFSSKCKDLFQLKSELSRPLRKYNNAGKIGVESKEQMRARNVDSPNLADMCVMAYDPGNIPEVRGRKNVVIPNAVTAFSDG
jgi:phage terminase large subunit